LPDANPKYVHKKPQEKQHQLHHVNLLRHRNPGDRGRQFTLDVVRIVGGVNMNEKLLSKYQCGNCSSLHDDEDEASDCCTPRVQEVFVCAGCERKFFSESLGEKHVFDCKLIAPTSDYVQLLFEGLPPITAWEKSHRVISDERRIIEEVLLGEAS
jgi:hypothetical protein